MDSRNDIFESEKLDGRRARLAYPLVHLFDSAITPGAWADFVRRWCRQPADRGGLMAIRDRRGYLHALFTYRVEHNLRFGRFLRVADIVMGQLPGETLVRSLRDSADVLAERFDCATIVVEPAANGPTGRLLGGPELTPSGYLRGSHRMTAAAH